MKNLTEVPKPKIRFGGKASSEKGAAEFNKNSRATNNLRDGLILLAIFAVGLSLRIVPVHNGVFGGGFTNFLFPDSWYHVRIIENLLQHFPFRMNYDPYTFFPNGQSVWFAPFFDELTGFCAWVIGLGSPSINTIHTVAAYVPAVLGALISVPVYFAGKAFFDRRVGLLAATIAVVLPSPYFQISLLGYVDHHVAEVFFSTTSVLFLVLALRQVKANPVSFSQFQKGEWRRLAKPLVFAILSGVFLGIYLLTWVGGLFFVFLFFCWAIIMFIISHLKQESTDYVCILGVPIFLIALIMVVPFLDQLAFARFNVISLVIGIVVLPILSGISQFISRREMKPAYYPMSLVLLGVVGLLAFDFVDPSLFGSMLQQFQVFAPDKNLGTVSEVRPLFFVQGPFSLAAYWSYFTTSSFLAPLGFILLLVITIRDIEAEKILLLMWGVIMFAAAAGQTRFAEYLTVVYALLGAFLIWKAIDWIPAFLKYFNYRPRQETRKEKARRLKEQSKLARGQFHSVKKDSPGEPRPMGSVYRLVWFTLAAILVIALAIYPNIQQSTIEASFNVGMNKDWYNALTWMKSNTPEPFPDPNYFYALYQKPAGDKYDYPPSAYSVLSWWDYGHYITEVAHRIPNANPNQSGAGSVAAYFVTPEEATANKMMDQLGSRYVIIDLNMITVFTTSNLTGSFYAIISWAGKDLTQYCDVYYQTANGKLTPVIEYYPDYYFCMSTRLFNFHGEQVTPKSTTVISYNVDSGNKLLQSTQSFPTYDQAKSFVDSHPTGNHRIASTSPFISPVPLEKLNHYEQVYVVDSTNLPPSPYLEIFKYSP
jgi:oligosaccharyl transferase (archaeosortase A-associated)